MIGNEHDAEDYNLWVLWGQPVSINPITWPNALNTALQEVENEGVAGAMSLLGFAVMI